MEFQTLNELKIKAIHFYKRLNIYIDSEEMEDLALQSLMMPQFTKQFNDANKTHLNDHRALATVGDAMCSCYLMTREFKPNSSMEELTIKKILLTNANLNVVGEKLLKAHLFASNNDLKEDNKKVYATAFEAVIGFISIYNKPEAFRILDEYLK